ncbi:hypothetical protein BurMR1_4334 [Burkholderia sp. MR1]|nr:hypothetical protein BurMR1_4334 [Burkholderia sp. MR1]
MTDSARAPISAQTPQPPDPPVTPPDQPPPNPIPPDTNPDPTRDPPEQPMQPIGDPAARAGRRAPGGLSGVSDASAASSGPIHRIRARLE